MESFACAQCCEPTARICPTCALLQQSAPLLQQKAHDVPELRHHALSMEVVHVHCLRCNIAINPECNLCRSSQPSKRPRRSYSQISTSSSSVQSPTESTMNVLGRVSQQETVPAEVDVSPQQKPNMFQPAFNHHNLTQLLNAKDRICKQNLAT